MQLTFKHKGSRTYVHGTDIYTKALAELQEKFMEISKMDLSFHGISTKNLTGKMVPEDYDITQDPSHPVSILKFSTEKGASKLLMYENDKAVEGRYAYDEEGMVAKAKINEHEKSIVLSEKLEFLNIEKVVALNKALLTQVLPGAGKWYFTRLVIPRDINSFSPKEIKVILVKNIGVKITRSNILFDNQPVGQIFFSKQ